MLLVFHCKPNAKNARIVAALEGGTYVAHLTAPARDDLANHELLNLIADKLNLPKTFVVLLRGHTSRVKHVVVPDDTDLKTLHPK